ncbi:MAG: hypothetical protein AB7R89_12545 [Dehalococcoidia bacterium]
MNETASRAARLGLRLLLDALHRRSGAPTTADEPEQVPGIDAWVGRGTIGSRPLVTGVAMVTPPAGDGHWFAAKTALEQRIGQSLDGGYVLWAPAGADLPQREPGRSEFITRVEAAAAALAPGAGGEVRFPVSLYLRKSDEEGGYITARGGLAPHWARFTGRVFGHFQLDSTELHRLPSAEGYAGTLIDAIALTANSLKLGSTETIEADDAWTIQRLSDGTGLTIIGEPPGLESSSGAALRRSIRRTLPALRDAMLETVADARVIGFVGPYASFQDQPVGTALLGMDPALFGGLDLILLAADGQVGPILELTRLSLLGEPST